MGPKDSWRSVAKTVEPARRGHDQAEGEEEEERRKKRRCNWLGNRPQSHTEPPVRQTSQAGVCGQMQLCPLEVGSQRPAEPVEKGEDEDEDEAEVRLAGEAGRAATLCNFLAYPALAIGSSKLHSSLLLHLRRPRSAKRSRPLICHQTISAAASFMPSSSWLVQLLSLLVSLLVSTQLWHFLASSSQHDERRARLAATARLR